jgi:hypothetical protein
VIGFINIFQLSAFTLIFFELARYYHRSPELISYQEVAGWLYYLIKERGLSASSVDIAVNAVRFLYGVTTTSRTLSLGSSSKLLDTLRRLNVSRIGRS